MYYPKEKILDLTVALLKKKCEDTWVSNDAQNHNFVKLIRPNRRNGESVYQYWNRMVQATAECKIGSLQPQEVENALTVAAFTAGVNDEETVKAIWEKKMVYKDLATHVKQLNQTQQILQQVKNTAEDTDAKDTKVKQEPIGLVKKTKDGKNKSRRCGGEYKEGHIVVCKAKNRKCNICKKIGHFQQVCMSDKAQLKKHKRRDKDKIQRVEQEFAENSEELEVEYSDETSVSETSSTSSSDECTPPKRRGKCSRVRENNNITRQVIGKVFEKTK